MASSYLIGIRFVTRWAPHGLKCDCPGWGRERGKQKHPFPEQDQCSEQDCRNHIGEIVQKYQQRIEVSQVLEHFDRMLPECRTDGGRFQQFLFSFSGKDLLFGMESGLQLLGFNSPGLFIEKILKGIEQAVDVWTWLPEWQHLRALIESVDTNNGPSASL